jgi:hypothetical protein
VTKAPLPFAVCDCTLITLAVGRSAQSLRELRDAVAAVPVASLDHHFNESLLRPSFDDPEYRNDFALWVHASLRDEPLAERVAMLDPIAFADGEALRGALLDLLEESLAASVAPVVAPPGHEFQFLRSQLVIFDTGLTARTPRELARRVREMAPGSVYFHVIDGRLRPPRGEDDFRVWLSQWGESGEAGRAALAGIDTMFGSLDELRDRIATALVGVYGEPG